MGEGAYYSGSVGLRLAGGTVVGTGFLVEDVAWRRIVKIVGARRTSEMPSPSVVSRGASNEEKKPIVLSPVTSLGEPVTAKAVPICRFKLAETIKDSLISGQRRGVGF